MFDTKYRIVNIMELSRSNPMHDEIVGKICYPAYFAVGERGMFLVDAGEVDWYGNSVHRCFTSPVKEVVVNSDDGFTVTTKNSKYTFRAVTEE